VFEQVVSSIKEIIKPDRYNKKTSTKEGLLYELQQVISLCLTIYISKEKKYSIILLLTI